MHGQSFLIRPSRLEVKLYLFGGAVLLLGSLWMGHQLITTQDVPWQLFAVTFGFGLLGIIGAILRSTTTLQYEDGYLTYHNLFQHQRVQLNDLVSAEKYPVLQFAGPNFLRLKLVDKNGGRLLVTPHEFRLRDFEALVALISPYISRTNVDKNFTNLQFYIEQGMNLPKLSAWRVIRGTFLFVLLPCLALTVILILWAMVTKQPTFR